MTSSAYKPHRSALYLPANNARAIEKARSIDTDVLIFDLEDAVSPEMKGAARENLVSGFKAGGFGRSKCVLRVNHLDTAYFPDDLAVLSSCDFDAVLIPKVSQGATLERIAGHIRSMGLRKVPSMWAMIETPEALVNLNAIAEAGRGAEPPLECLIVGTNDIAKETGVSMSDDRAYMLPWLMSIVLTAKRWGLTVLDGVWNDFRDLAGFERELRQAQKMGFDGKTLIHPSQVALANGVFAPSEAAIAEARAIVEAFQRPENAGLGVINMDGKMVELLHLEMARRLLSVQAGIAG